MTVQANLEQNSYLFGQVFTVVALISNDTNPEFDNNS